MGFECYHPVINLIYFISTIVAAILFKQPVFLVVSYISAFAYSVKRNRWRAVVFNVCLIPLIMLFSLYYSSYHHFGLTILRQNYIGNNMTVESFLYGLTLGVIAAAVSMWMSCVFSVFTADKVVYLFGRLSPKLSLYLSIILRIVPRTKQQAKKISTARKAIGRGISQGNMVQRLLNAICILSMLITWLLESMSSISDSMRSRGSILRGRTAFSIYRFDNRDRGYVLIMVICMTITWMGYMLQQTDIIYDPCIIMPPITIMSYVFYIGYGILCNMPLALELWTEFRFRYYRK